MEFLASLLPLSAYELRNLVALMGIYAILAISLNVICGMTGLLQLGHAGFFAVGAYVAGLIAMYAYYPALREGNLVLLCIPAAMVAAALCALVIGVPCLRLRGDYLAIATLGFGEIIRLVFSNLEFPGSALTNDRPFGGPTGIRFPDTVEYAAYTESWLLIWVFVAVTYIVLRNIKDSAAGRALMCIREDEIAARAMGIHVPQYKVLAFVLSAAFAGMAGALFFHHTLAINPNNFNLLKSIEVLLMVVLGGLGSLSGALIAAVLLTALPQVMMQLGFGEYRQLAFALLLVILIRLVPDGILGLNELPGWLQRKPATDREGRP